MQVEKAYGSYEELIADKDVQAVYIPLPNNLHLKWVKEALSSGKHVICEKPLALNADEAKEMFDTAKENGVYLMEAYAYLHSPYVESLKKDIADGVIGDVDYIETAFVTQGYKEDIRLHKDLGGGAMYDLGCYCTTMILSLIDSEPEYVKASAEFTDLGVDAMTSGIIRFENSVRAAFNVGKPNRDALMRTAQYLKGKGVTVKGHPLCCHTACADWLMKYDNETILKKQLERIDREVKGFKGVIDMWDVINEVVIMPIFDKYDNAITRICKEKGRVGLIKEVFDRAHADNPDAVLLLNDFNTSINYEILIDGCLNAGVPISAIGIQSHQHQGYWGIEKLEEVLERFSHFGLPIHFTENTLISGDIMPAHIVDLNDWQVDEWPSTPEGESRQAKQIEEMYRTLFEHPLVEAITTWDYRDGAWLKAPSGYIRLDNSKKPSYEMLKDLVKNEWWTDASVKTDENGCIMVDAFKGSYRISVGKSAAELEFTDDTEMTVTFN